jgi:hypothetical protein
MFERMLPNYAKRKCTSIDYEQMVMEVQYDVDEGMRIGKLDSEFDQ